jgi:hypothetical protein
MWMRSHLAPGLVNMTRSKLFIWGTCMFIKLEKLSIEADGRYASDDELQFVVGYTQSFNARMQAYTKIHAAEHKIVEEVHTKMRSQDPKSLQAGNEDISAKWKRDTFRVMRFAALNVLLDDPDHLKEQFLFWYQTIMQAFSAERSCNLTYSLMQEIVKKFLEPSEVALLQPALELSRDYLGGSAK